MADAATSVHARHRPQHYAVVADRPLRYGWRGQGGSAIVWQASPQRLAAGLAGPLLLGLGSGISVSAGFGAFGFSVLLDGMHHQAGLPLWFSQIVLTLLLSLFALHWARIPFGPGTVSALLLTGPAMSFGATLAPTTLALGGNLLAFAGGLFLFSLGISLAAAAALGPDGVTAVALAVEKRRLASIPRANFTINLLAILLGMAAGGNTGPASFVGLLVVPMLIRTLLPKLRAFLASCEIDILL